MHRSRSTSKSPRPSSRLVQRLLGPAERKPTARRRRLRSELLEDRRLLAGWTQQDQVFAFTDPIDPESDANLGSVAVDGDVMVVGARRDDHIATDAGAVYIYRRDNAGTPNTTSDDFWRHEALLTASDAAAGDTFGHSVSISEDTVVVGSPRDDEAGGDSGSAYVFTHDGSSWIQQAKLIANDDNSNDEFGVSVSVSGDTVVVGSHEDDDAGTSSGSAYVFTRSGASWSQQAKLTASDADRVDFFGSSVSVSGDTVVVGSPSADAAGFIRGAAYVFTRSGASWSEIAKLSASDPALSRRFGNSVSVSGDTIVVGDRDGTGGTSSSGVAYVFNFDGADWSEQARLIASDAASSDRFGASVSISNDTVVVGSYGDDDAGPFSNSGSAYVFTRSGASWTQQAKLTASDAAANDLFGGYVAVSGDTVVAGSIGHDVVKDGLSIANAGSAYAFIASGGSWSQQDQVFAFSEGPQASAEHGTSVAVDGDVMVVGAPFEKNTGANAGAVYVYRRDDAGTEDDTSDDFWVDEARLTASDGASGDNFGDSVSVFGDTVVVGSPRDNDDGGDSGSAYVFTYNGTSWNEQEKLTASDAAADDRFGQSITIYEDTLVVGSPNNGVSGAAYVFTRSGGSWGQRAKLIASDAGFRDRFGESVSVSRDTVVVGSSEAGTQVDGGFTSGSAYVFTPNGNTWTQQAKLKAGDAAANDRLGRSVSVSGDTVVVGSWLDDDDGYNSGSAYVFVRSGTTWSEQAKLTASDAERYNSFGHSVSVSGDTVVIGSAADEDQTFSYTGSAYVFTRRGTSWSEQAKLIASDAARNDFFGYSSVSVSGDTVAVGSFRDDVIKDGQSIADAGSAYVFVADSIPVDYDFTSAVFAAAEGDSTNTSSAVMLTRSDASVTETVEVTLTDGTATAGSDFTAGPISVTFDAGELTKPVPIEILGDLMVESDQSLTLSLASFSESGQIGATIPTATLTITNDDSATITIDDLSQDEESGTFTFKAILDNPVEGGFTVDYSIAGVDTESGDITSPLFGTLTFAGGAGESQNIVVTVADDLIVEGDETFTVSLGAITPSGTPAVDAADVDTSDTATGTIVNTDKATISIADASVVEGSGGTTELEFTITSTNPSEEDLTVQVDTAEILGQALGGGVDFTDIVGGSATIAGDSISTSTSVTVVLNADYFAEADEAFEVNLSNPQFGGSSDPSRVELGDAQAIGTIVDDDLENSIVVGDCPCGGDLAGTKAIFVNGSSLDDKINVKLGLVAGTYKIEIKAGSTQLDQTIDPADHGAVISTVVIYGLDGNDDIKIHGDVDGLRGFLFGGAGDDKIKGGKSDDVLIGGSGDDRLDGHQGRDLVIGGTGADKINGEKDEDILVGGSTDFDDNHLAALCAILDEWTRSDNTFQDRVNNVYDGTGDPGALNGSFTLENHVQLSDGAVDDLKGGGSDTDWFVTSEADGDTYDQLQDGEAFWSDVEALFFET